MTKNHFQVLPTPIQVVENRFQAPRPLIHVGGSHFQTLQSPIQEFACRRHDKMGRMKQEQEPDDFFAPRPKLSWRLRAIRAIALLAAIFIAIGFFIVEMFALGGGFFGPTPATLQDKIFAFIVPTLVQIALLVPCWRCWLLHRWACVATVLLLFFLSDMALSLVGLYGVTHSIGKFAAVCLAACIGAEWHNLKKGF